MFYFFDQFFYFICTNSVLLQIWRPKEGNKYELIDETRIDPEWAGIMHVEFAVDCEFCYKVLVEPGDTLGFYFADEAVIPFYA